MGRGTYAIAEVYYQVLYLQRPRLKLRINPTRRNNPPLAQSTHYQARPVRGTHHFVNVFCCTVIHRCCSANAILTRPCSWAGSTAASASAFPVAELRKRRRLPGVASLSLAGESARWVAERWTLAALSSFLARLSRGRRGAGEGEEPNVGAEGSSGEHLCEASSRVGVVALVEVSETETEKSEGAELIIDAVRRALEDGLTSWVCAGAMLDEVESRCRCWVVDWASCEDEWAAVSVSKHRSGNFSCSAALPGC